MARTRSAKGTMVDFDLLKIRQKLSAQPVTLNVKAREDFIDKKLRRRMRKAKVTSTAVEPTDDTVDSEALIAVETPVAGALIDPPKTEVKPAETKQKNRPPVK